MPISWQKDRGNEISQKKRPPTLLKLRLEMRYSFAEMAECLGLKKATYQGYETNRRKPPDSVIRDAIYYRDLGMKFIEELPARVDEYLAQNTRTGL